MLKTISDEEISKLNSLNNLIKKQDLSQLRVFLEKEGVEFFNKINPYSGGNLMFNVVIDGNLEMIKLFLTYDVKLNLINKSGQNLLYLSLLYGNKKDLLGIPEYFSFITKLLNAGVRLDEQMDMSKALISMLESDYPQIYRLIQDYKNLDKQTQAQSQSLQNSGFYSYASWLLKSTNLSFFSGLSSGTDRKKGNETYSLDNTKLSNIYPIKS